MENEELKEAIRSICISAAGQQLSPELAAALCRARQVADIGPGQLEQDERETSGPSVEEQPQVQVSSSPDDPEAPVDQRLGYDAEAPEYEEIKAHHYLGDGMLTLSGRFFWDYMVYIFMQFQRTIFTDLPHSEENYVGPSLMGSANMSEADYLVAMAGARVDYIRSFRGQPTYSGPSTARISELAQRQRSIRQNVLAKRSDVWKTPEQVAKYLLQRLSPDQASSILDTVQGTASPEVSWKISRQLSTLARNAVCFEDGPRWSILFVSIAVGSWVRVHKGELHADGW